MSQSACFAHEGHLLVTLVSQNVCFAHEGRTRVTLVSQNVCFAHEGRLRVTLVSRNVRPDFGNDSPYLFTPMYEASFKGTKR